MNFVDGRAPRGQPPALLIAAALAGLGQALAIAWPPTGQPQWWLQLLAMATYAGLLNRAHGRAQGFVLGWTFAVTWIAGSVWWLYIAMHTYGGLPAVLAVLAVALLAGFLALPYGLAGAWTTALPATDGWRMVGFGASWLAAELIRGMGWWGFGWGAAGYAHVQGPLAAYAPWIGVYGIGLVAAMVAMGGAMTLASLRVRRAGRAQGRAMASGITLLSVVALIGMPWVMGPVQTDRTESLGTLDVALLQGNIPQNEKFEAGLGVPMALQWYGDALQDNRSALVVAPETAIPLLPRQLPPGYLDALQARYASGRQLALVGVPLGSYSAGYTNSALALGPAGAGWQYDKHHLVPFGEIIPWGFHWFNNLMHIPLSDFRAGDLVQPSLAWQGQRLAVNICYEDLFGEELAARFANEADAPTLFVNLSNIAWFGEGQAIDQHLSITRMRALELGRAFVRATNTGATAIVDHRGTVQALLPRATRAVLTGTVEGRKGLTPYARWISRTGLWPWWALVAVAILVVRRRGRQQSAEAP